MSHDIAESRLNDIHEVYNHIWRKINGYKPISPCPLVFPLSHSQHTEQCDGRRLGLHSVGINLHPPHEPRVPNGWGLLLGWGYPPEKSIYPGQGKSPMFHGKKHFHTRGCLQIRFQIMDECPNTNVFVPLGFKLPKGKPFGLPFPTRIHI